MALFKCCFYSKYLSYATNVNVIIPENSSWQEEEQDEKYKVLYLLHGRGDNHDSWVQNSQIAFFAQEHQIAVVMPTAEDSFYVDSVTGKRYFSYLTDELPKYLKKYFPLSDKAEDTFIAGLSMGGYGTLKIGLTYPERFAAIGILSAAVRPDHMPDFHDNDKDREILKDNLGRTIGEGELRDEDNPYCLLKKCFQENKKLPAIFQYIGTEDFLYGMNQDLRKFLQENHVEASYEEWEGIHDWRFWNVAVERFINQIGKEKNNET